MAFIPDEAIDSMDELTKGARLYYVWLCRVRNQKTGRCFPSVETTMESLGINRGTVYTLRKELQERAWATFTGNNADLLKGFNSPKNQTMDAKNKDLRENSLIFQTISPESLKNQTQESEKSDKKSEKSDSYIRSNQQTITSKGNHARVDENLGSALEEIYPGHSTNFRTMRELAELVGKVDGTAADVRRFPDWLRDRYPKKANSPFAFRDLFSEFVKTSHAPAASSRSFCGHCRGGWIPPGPGESRARRCECNQPASTLAFAEAIR